MAIRILILSLISAFTFSSLAQSGSPLEIDIGSVRVKVVLGNIVKQDTEALALSHWPDGVNDGGGIGGAIANAGGIEAIEKFGKIMEENGGSLRYGSVFETPLDPKTRGDLKSRYLFHIIELKAIKQLQFTRVNSVNASERLTPNDKIAYIALLTKYADAISEQQARATAAQAAYYANPIQGTFQAYLNALPKGRSSEFEVERDKLLEFYQKPIGFETVALGVRNALATADRLGVKSISFGTMGYGIMGDLTIEESVAAMATGAKLYAAGVGVNPSAEPRDMHIVLFASDTAENRAQVAQRIGPVFRNGGFLKMASTMMAHGEFKGIDWAHLQKDFKEQDRGTLTPAKISAWTSIRGHCERLLGRMWD